jgi:hypothetical protein
MRKLYQIPWTRTCPACRAFRKNGILADISQYPTSELCEGHLAIARDMFTEFSEWVMYRNRYGKSPLEWTRLEKIKHGQGHDDRRDPRECKAWPGETEQSLNMLAIERSVKGPERELIIKFRMAMSKLSNDDERRHVLSGAVVMLRAIELAIKMDEAGFRRQIEQAQLYADQILQEYPELPFTKKSKG